jgi:hypothetical protein
MKKVKEVSKKHKALIIVNSNPGITAREFAREFWPDHPGWNRVKNGGNGSVKGKGMWMLGGSYLRKLQKAGLIRTELRTGTQTVFFTTQAGRQEASIK